MAHTQKLHVGSEVKLNVIFQLSRNCFIGECMPKVMCTTENETSKAHNMVGVRCSPYYFRFLILVCFVYLLLICWNEPQYRLGKYCTVTEIMDEFRISAVMVNVDIRVQYKSKFYVMGKKWKCIFGELHCSTIFLEWHIIFLRNSYPDVFSVSEYESAAPKNSKKNPNFHPLVVFLFFLPCFPTDFVGGLASLKAECSTNNFFQNWN